MRFRHLAIRLQTTDGPYGTALSFPDGLVVVWADNSMGKSTCVKAILVALGMEAMLTTQQSDLPLPPAVKSRLESDSGEFDVLESEVFLEIENPKGQRIVVQRTIKGARDKNLVTVHLGPILTVPGVPVQSQDYFVNRAGAASRDAGFHFFLANFLGWDLPQVQTYDGSHYPLYMQCVFPYFVVEQTRGWSSVEPPIPSHFRIREAHKRAVEFILDLDAHRNALLRQEIEVQRNRIAVDWAAQLGRANELGERKTAQVQGLSSRPVATWPPVATPSLMVLVGAEWVPISRRVEASKSELAKLVTVDIPRVQEIATTAQSELTTTEDLIKDKQTLLSRLLDSYSMEVQELSRVQERLKAIETDIQRNKDIRVLKNLGSNRESAIDNGLCPVCHQAVHDSLLPIEANQNVMSLDESIEFLTEQHRTYEVVMANARSVAESRDLQIRSIRTELNALRETARALRQTLVSDGRLPSTAAIQNRIRIENSIDDDVETLGRFETIVDGFGELSVRWKQLLEDMQKVSKEDASEADKRKIEVWGNALRDQLTQYGFRSFPVSQISISSDTYRPEHQGFEIEISLAQSNDQLPLSGVPQQGTSLQNSISASDLIRTIWSYLNGLLEISRTEKSCHPGCVLFDEPRQQSTKDVSFAELLKRAAVSKKFGQQVIFFTSENKERLIGHLSGIDHSFVLIEGRVIKRLSI